MPVRQTTPSSLNARILLVDDNANGLAARKSVLQELGHKIVTASCGADALAQFNEHRFDLVITDYKMPKIDGVELIARLRKLSPELPIVLISGFVDTLGLSEESTGADAVIQKSAHEVSHLVRTVGRLLKRKPASKKPAAQQPPALKVKRKGA